MTRLLFDTEGNGFVNTATKFHCIGIIDVETGRYDGYRPDRLGEAVRRLEQADEIIGHNIQRHDVPLLKRLAGFQPKAGQQLRDTMIMARVIYPNVKASDKALIDRGRMPAGRDYQGKHTIAAWGYRLGCPKGDYAQVRRAQALALGLTDETAITEYVWGEFNEDMFQYMEQDCLTNFELWKHLRPDEYSQAAIELEHRAARVCDAIEQAGVPFDLAAAQDLHTKLLERKHVIEQRLKAEFGFWYQPVSPDPTKALFTPKKKNAKRGFWGGADETWEYTNEKGVTEVITGYPMTKIKPVEFNPGSRDHIARKLQERGWVPEKYTDGGNPKLDEETLEMVVARYPEMDGIGEYLMVEKRISQLVGTNNSLIERTQDDGRIHGAINPMGTITSRAAHMYPNLGQVPSAKKPYGHDFRDLFGKGPGMPRGWVMVGADQEGLELRGLAHYLAKHDGGKYSEVVCTGDPHWLHAGVMGLVSPEVRRDKENSLHTIIREDGSKRVIYSYIYGAGDEKVGTIIYECALNAKKNGGPEGLALYERLFQRGATTKGIKKVGREIRENFANRIEGFSKLKRLIAEQVEKRGRIKGLDGRLTPIRSDHSALNFMIQSAGAIICKRWLADAYDECCARFREGWDGDFCFVLWVHDEIQVCCRKEIAEEVGDILVRCARKAGEPYGFRVPLDSKYSVGSSWADTH